MPLPARIRRFLALLWPFDVLITPGRINTFPGVNVLQDSNLNPAELLRFHLELKPAFSVVVNRYELAEMLAQQTTTNIAYRSHPDDSIETLTTPEAWWAKMRPLAKHGIWLVAGNEPGWTDAMFAWQNTIADLAIRDNVRVILVNNSVGTPEESEIWRGNALFRKIAAYPHILRLGVHEYAGGIATTGMAGYDLENKDYDNWAKPNLDTLNAYHCGRFLKILRWCQSAGIPLKGEHLVITEHAPAETLDDIKPWQLAQAGINPHTKLGYKNWRVIWERWWPWQNYARSYVAQVKWMHDNIYAPLGIPTVLFSYGDSGGWELYDIAHDAVLFAHLMEWRRDYDMATSTPPVPAPEGDWSKAKFLGVANYRIRSQPDETKSNILGLLAPGTIHIFKQVATKSTAGAGYDWAYISADNLTGWVALIKTVGASVVKVSLADLFEIIPDEQPPAPPPSVAVPINELAALEDLLVEARTNMAEMQSVLDSWR